MTLCNTDQYFIVRYFNMLGSSFNLFGTKIFLRTFMILPVTDKNVSEANVILKYDICYLTRTT